MLKLLKHVDHLELQFLIHNVTVSQPPGCKRLFNLSLFKSYECLFTKLLNTNVLWTPNMVSVHNEVSSSLLHLEIRIVFPKIVDADVFAILVIMLMRFLADLKNQPFGSLCVTHILPFCGYFKGQEQICFNPTS